MRTLAIGDIHGYLTARDALLAAVQPTPEDLLITLGDYVDRGPDSRGVLDRLLELDGAYRLIPLRGNHELMMIDAQRLNSTRVWTLCGGEETLWSYGGDGRLGQLDDVPTEHWNFIRDRCVDYHETQTHLYVHAVADPGLPLAEQDEEHFFWRKLTTVAPHVSGKTMICGHTVQTTGLPLNLGHAVCIDTWVYGRGYLTCLDTESGHYWQANRNGQTREGDLNSPRPTPTD